MLQEDVSHDDLSLSLDIDEDEDDALSPRKLGMGSGITHR